MKMTSVVASAYGGPELLEVVESELNDPAAGEVLIEVRAAATNPVDYKLYSGTYGADPSNLPMRLGFEAAGIVVGINGEPEGPGGRIAVGDEVIAYRALGAYASALLVEADNALPKPPNMTFEEASGLMLTGVTESDFAVLALSPLSTVTDCSRGFAPSHRTASPRRSIWSGPTRPSTCRSPLSPTATGSQRS